MPLAGKKGGIFCPLKRAKLEIWLGAFTVESNFSLGIGLGLADDLISWESLSVEFEF